MEELYDPTDPNDPCYLPPCSAHLCAEPAIGEAPGDTRPADLCLQHAKLVVKFRSWLSAPDEDNPGESLEASLAWWEIHRRDQV